MTETPRAAAPRPRSGGGTGRAALREEFRASRTGEFDPAALADAVAELVAGGAEPGPDLAAEGERPAHGDVARIFASSNAQRWVPIGPSVVLTDRLGDYPRVTGRVRDLRVSSDGRRAYAATAKGGLWYSGDGGALWSPVGGWADRPGTRGGHGNAQACGCLLVDFGADVTADFVMVGTGELQGFSRAPIRPALGGIGVLAARRPAVTAGAGGDPWETESGRGVLEGLGCFALARAPFSTAGDTTGAGLDRVLLGTTEGLFLGTRRPAGPPPGGEFTWALLPALGPFRPPAPPALQPLVTDVLWLPGAGPPKGRIVVVLALGLETATAAAPEGSGVAVSDDLGATFRWVTGLDPTVALADKGIGRMSLARAGATNRVYVLGERRTLAATDHAAVWRIADASAATPTATLLTGVPDVWRRSPTTGKNQRDYDQTIAVDPVDPATDRLYLGGNVVVPPGETSVWCLQVPVAGGALVPAPEISRAGPVPAGDGADPAGLIGNGVHADVHMIRVTGAALPRQVWVATDGGIFVSTLGGRVNTFAPRSTGLAALEVNFVAAHPTSSHLVAAGTQDNGQHVRVGDAVWEEFQGGDGGGVTFHPTATHLIVSQAAFAAWSADPSGGFVDPLQNGAPAGDRENGLAAFYSGAAAVQRAPAAARTVVGTNRVWLTEDLAVAATNAWRVLPYPSGTTTNPRPGGTDPVPKWKVGVPGGAPLPPVVGGVGPLGAVITQKWASATELLVVFVNGVVRWTFSSGPGTWAARVLVAPAGVVLSPAVTGAPDPRTTLLSDVAPVPGTSNFYLVTTGDRAVAPGDTCLYFHDATSTFYRTDLRAQLAPLDPAYASVVDPAAPTDVYVGTVTGVWRGARGAGPPGAGAPWPHAWASRLNGLPQAAVQDLGIWHDPAGPAGTPRLLRAAMQSRGVWELDLAAPTEPERTYVKVHARDDRRRLPTPMKDPRRPPAAPDVAGTASPDIVVRPRGMTGIEPAWPLAPGAHLDSTTVNPPYTLWTFQTAFRWLFPAVTPDGQWTPRLEAFILLHRRNAGIAPVLPQLDKPLWDAVVRGVRVSAGGAVNVSPADPLAVYRAPWQTAIEPNAVATELDLLRHVVGLPPLGGEAQVFNEKSTVDLLVHHRDIRRVSSGTAFAFLFWKSAAVAATLLGLDAAPLRTYVAAVLAGGPLPALVDWDVVMNGAGQPKHPLPVDLDARMPRAVSIDLDLSAVPDGHRVLLVAVVGSDVDPCGLAPVGLPATPNAVDLARRWPYAAARLVRVSPRP